MCGDGVHARDWVGETGAAPSVPETFRIPWAAKKVGCSPTGDLVGEAEDGITHRGASCLPTDDTDRPMNVLGAPKGSFGARMKSEDDVSPRELRQMTSAARGAAVARKLLIPKENFTQHGLLRRNRIGRGDRD